MKKKIIAPLLVLLSLLFYSSPVFADTLSPLNIDASVDVPKTCNVTDTDGTVHPYAAPSADSYIAICALKAALDSGSVVSAEFSNAYPDLGLFVTSFNGITADPNSQYWALYQNGSFASLGLSILPIVAGDTLKLELHDFSDNTLGDSVVLHINSLIQPAPHHHSGGSVAYSSIETFATDNVDSTPGSVLGASTEVKPGFDIDKAFGFLLTQQKDNGSFGDDLYTDWTAVSLGTTLNYKAETIK
ncbi:MAG: DUF4430 domain-containing protein, partial [Minisyncoccia bacterium]